VRCGDDGPNVGWATYLRHTIAILHRRLFPPLACSPNRFRALQRVVAEAVADAVDEGLGAGVWAFGAEQVGLRGAF
jgi:hypothetical protein